MTSMLHRSDSSPLRLPPTLAGLEYLVTRAQLTSLAESYVGPPLEYLFEVEEAES